jgi:hypothetical protein
MKFMKRYSSFLALAIVLMVSACGKGGGGLNPAGGGSYIGSLDMPGTQCVDYRVENASEAGVDAARRQVQSSFAGTSQSFTQTPCKTSGRLGLCTFMIKGGTGVEVYADIQIYSAASFEQYKSTCAAYPNGKFSAN